MTHRRRSRRMFSRYLSLGWCCKTGRPVWVWHISFLCMETITDSLSFLKAIEKGRKCLTWPWFPPAERCVLACKGCDTYSLCLAHALASAALQGSVWTICSSFWSSPMRSAPRCSPCPWGGQGRSGLQGWTVEAGSGVYGCAVVQDVRKCPRV